MQRLGRGSGSGAGHAGTLIAAVFTVVAVAAACAAPGAGSSAAPTAAGTSNPPAAGGLTLEARAIPGIGQVMVGADGRSLYVFLSDTAGTSACVDACTATWPPLTVAAAGDVTAGTGVTGALGTITRTDGSTQVTLGGAPLYYYAADTKAGDAQGHGIGDVWFLATPAGDPAELVGPPSPGPEQPSPTPCGGRSCY
jgi:predicted lipoprotein with Yx(FWY)xxD motif